VRAEAECLFAIASRRDIRPSTALANEGPDPGGVVATISQQQRSRPQPGQEFEREPIVVESTRG